MSRLRVPGVMNFDALREQPFPATLTATRESSATALGAHPGTETVLMFPCPFRGLVGAFHKQSRRPGDRRAGKLKACRCLSIRTPPLTVSGASNDISIATPSAF